MHHIQYLQCNYDYKAIIKDEAGKNRQIVKYFLLLFPVGLAFVQEAGFMLAGLLMADPGTVGP